jgi:predicted small secreted protein
MKRIPILVLLLVAACLTMGCFGPDVAKAMKELAKDPASVHLRVSSVYGVIEFTRTAPLTNTLAHSISPDGTITVTDRPQYEPALVPAPLRGASRVPPTPGQ